MTEIVYTTDDPRVTLRFATEEDVPPPRGKPELYILPKVEEGEESQA